MTAFIYNKFFFSRAKLLLRKKKYQEGLLARTDGQLDNLERLVHDLEFAQVEKQVLTDAQWNSPLLSLAAEFPTREKFLHSLPACMQRNFYPLVALCFLRLVKFEVTHCETEDGNSLM